MPGFISLYRGEQYHLRDYREEGGVPFSYSQGHALFLVEAEVHCTCLLCYQKLY